MRRDIIGDVSRIVHPLPEQLGPGADEHELDGWKGWYEDVLAEQRRLQGDMEGAWDAEDDADPLLGEIVVAREAMLAAQMRLRRLVAYGREFVGPRPYKLDDLARAAGMSISGVRTAYDNDEIAEVQRLIGPAATAPRGDRGECGDLAQRGGDRA